jgi:hypothetical protein
MPNITVACESRSYSAMATPNRVCGDPDRGVHHGEPGKSVLHLGWIYDIDPVELESAHFLSVDVANAHQITKALASSYHSAASGSDCVHKSPGPPGLRHQHRVNRVGPVLSTRTSSQVTGRDIISKWNPHPYREDSLSKGSINVHPLSSDAGCTDCSAGHCCSGRRTNTNSTRHTEHRRQKY